MPKIVDHLQRRRELASAAMAVLARAGFEGTTMRSVAVEAGCTTGRVSHYFDDKDALLVAALALATERNTERIATVHAVDPTDLVGTLEAFLPLDEEARRWWGVWLSFYGRAAVAPDLRPELTVRYRAWNAAVAGVLRASRAGDPGRVGDGVEADAEHLVIAVDGIGLRACFDPDRWPAARQRRALAQHLARLGHLDRPADEDREER